MLVPARSRGPHRTQRQRGLSLPLLELLEPVDAALGIDDPLLAAEEGMAYRADLGLEFFLRRAGREFIAAQAGHDRVGVVGGMDGGFHGVPYFISRSRWPRAGASQPQGPGPHAGKAIPGRPSTAAARV